MRRQRWHLEDGEVVELIDAMIGILLQRCVKHGWGLGSETLEEGALLSPQPVDSVAACRQGAVPSDVHQQIERIDIHQRRFASITATGNPGSISSR
jgi:hypothetical protein